MCIDGPEGPACYGASGALTRVRPGDPASQTRLIAGLPSLAGPDGSGALGPHGVGFQGKGNGYLTIGLGADPARRLDLGPDGARFARLVRFQPNGKYTFEEDLGAFEALANPDGGLDDSNPFGVLPLAGRTIYADAGGNALNAVAANGTVTKLAVFGMRDVPHPFNPTQIVPMQAVPTSVARGPDGALYVGQLTGFPFPVGGANVYRLPPGGGDPEVYASGFTNIIGIAFAPDGALYVAEISAISLLNGPIGAVIKVTDDGQTSTPLAENLFAPGGITVGTDGAVYVTVGAVLPGGGQVLKIVP